MFRKWVILQFASARIGAVLVTVNTSYQSSELEYLLRQSDSTTLFFIVGFKGTSFPEVLSSIIDDSPNGVPLLKNLIFIGKEFTPLGMMSWTDMHELHHGVSDEELYAREQEIRPTTVINMQYTSGTTGFPKGVMLAHHDIANNGYLVTSAMKLTNEDRLCIPVPFFHCFGCVLGVLACVSVGATMLPIVEFEPEIVLRTTEKERCTGLHGVPTMFIAELNHSRFKDYDVSSLRTGIMAGSNCPIEVMKRVMSEMSMSDITIAYGQTEASPVITQTVTDDSIERRVQSVGKAHPFVEVKVIDPLTGKEVPRDTQGELCTRGYLVM